MRNAQDRNGMMLILRAVLLIAVGSALVVQVTYDLSTNITLAVILAIAAIVSVPTVTFVRTLMNPTTRIQTLTALRHGIPATVRYVAAVLAVIPAAFSGTIKWHLVSMRERLDRIIHAARAAMIRWFAARIVCHVPALAKQVLVLITAQSLAPEEREALLLAIAEELREKPQRN